MKKLIIFIVFIVALFGALAFMTTYQNKQATEGNPYGKSKLDPATVKQLKDPNYQNQILPDDLEKKLADGETLTVYFYSPTCSHCQEATPILVPMVDEMGIDLKKYNLLEFQQGWQNYGIEFTPTIIHFEKGKEVSRIVGNEGKEAFEKWFNSIYKEKK